MKIRMYLSNENEYLGHEVFRSLGRKIPINLVTLVIIFYDIVASLCNYNLQPVPL